MNFFCCVPNLFTGAGSLGLLTSLVLLAGLAPEAQAAVSCTVNAGVGITRAHNAGGTLVANGSSSFTVTCTRLTGDTTLGSLQIRNDRGQNRSADQQRAVLTGLGNCNPATDCLLYNLTRPIAVSLWSNNVPSQSIDLAFDFLSTAALSRTISITYDWNIPAPQIVTAGTFTDTVAIRAAYDFGAGINTAVASFPVTIVAPASCSFATAPGPVAFGNYNAFTTTAGAASTTFAANCTNNLQYTMALNATSGVAAGLRYTLALSATTAMGTGVAQTHTITGSIPAGQAGTCAAAACSQSVPHSVTITY